MLGCKGVTLAHRLKPFSHMDEDSRNFVQLKFSNESESERLKFGESVLSNTDVIWLVPSSNEQIKPKDIQITMMKTLRT